MNKRVGLPQPSLLQGRKSNFWIFLATTTTAAAAASSVKILGFKIVIVCQNCLDSFMERARASEQQANSDFSIISYTLSDVVWYSIFEYVHGHYFLLAQSTWDPMSGCFCRLLNISIVQGIEQYCEEALDSNKRLNVSYQNLRILYLYEKFWIAEAWLRKTSTPFSPFWKEKTKFETKTLTSKVCPFTALQCLSK